MSLSKVSTTQAIPRGLAMLLVCGLIGACAATPEASVKSGASATATITPDVATASPSAAIAPSAPAAPALRTALEWKAASGEADFIPWGLAQAPDGRLWAAEGVKDHFAIFEPDGAFVETWGTSGTGHGQFDLTRSNGDPYGMVAFAPDGSFFVLDPGNRRVQAFSPKRKYVTSWGGFGRDPGQFRDPVSLAVDADGNVAVLDDLRRGGVIETYSPSGDVLRTINAFPNQIGSNLEANQLAIGPNGHYYVSVVLPNQVVELDRDGNLVQVFGATRTPGAFTEQPNVVQFDSAGRLYVTQGPMRGDHPGVQVFAPDTTYIGGFGPLGAGDDELGFPWGLVVTDDGIYTADAGAVPDLHLSSLIRKFEPIAFP